MFMPLRRNAAVIVLLAGFLAGSALTSSAQSQAFRESPAATANERLGIGDTPSADLIKAWNIDISPAGTNLPEGSGSVFQGRQVFADSCASCHGEHGTEGPMDRLVGGKGTLDTNEPVMTVGSYWPYATTLYDYIRRAMPFNNPQSLTYDQIYAVAAYILNMNGIVPDDAALDKNSLPKIKMPNRGAFEETDTTTQAKSVACMKDCKPFVTEPEGAIPKATNKNQLQ
jgi:cytochrome c